MTAVSAFELNTHLKALESYLKEKLLPASDLFPEDKSLLCCDFIPSYGFLSDSLVADFPGLDQRISSLEPTFGEKVRAYCSSKKIRQSEIIDLTGIGRSTFYRILSGEIFPISTQRMSRQKIP